MDRWTFQQDMNQDGLISGNDFLLMGEWLFYLPGDGLLLLVIDWLPEIAQSLALTEASFGGASSKWLSIVGWLLGLWGLGTQIADFGEDLAAFRERHKTRFDLKGAGLGLIFATMIGMALGSTLDLHWLIPLSPLLGLLAGGLIGRNYQRKRLDPPTVTD